MNPIINLTQHAASADQIAVGVVDLTGPERETLLNALDFLTMPSSEEIKGRAKVIADLAALSSGQTGSAMIGGAFGRRAEGAKHSACLCFLPAGEQ